MADEEEAPDAALARIAVPLLRGGVEKTMAQIANDVVNSDTLAAHLDDVSSSILAQAATAAAGSIMSVPIAVVFPIGVPGSTIATGANYDSFDVPVGLDNSTFRASLSTVSNALFTVDIKQGGTSIFGTHKLTIDAGEKSSFTAATPADINPNFGIADGTAFTVDITNAGSVGAGLKISVMGFTRTQTFVT